jgi:FkbM family methyltransferase
MGKRFASALTHLVLGLSAVEKPWRRVDTRLRVAQGLLRLQRIETRHGPLSFVTTHPQALQYPREFETREPETLAWIDAFETPCRFWDIGANIGVFSIYAGLRAGVEVCAFEPAAASYAALCRNIEANRLDDRVRAFCAALGDRTELGSIYLSATNAGSVFNVFESTNDCFGHEITPVFRQGMLGFSIDGFRQLFGIPAPHYLKIDVDSIEERILEGGRQTLRDPALRSVLIEVEAAATPRNGRLTEALEAAGFRLCVRGERNQGGVVNAIFARGVARLEPHAVVA